jgi:hypothetical protein
MPGPAGSTWVAPVSDPAVWSGEDEVWVKFIEHIAADDARFDVFRRNAISN